MVWRLTALGSAELPAKARCGAVDQSDQQAVRRIEAAHAYR
jgi:hypothetical protein